VRVRRGHNSEESNYLPPEAAGLDVLIRGLSLIKDGQELLSLTGQLYHGLYMSTAGNASGLTHATFLASASVRRAFPLW
jgi:hypothetical protein